MPPSARRRRDAFAQVRKKDDLELFFKKEVPNAKPGDEQVSKFVGIPYQKGAGVEAQVSLRACLLPVPLRLLTCLLTYR